jgi:hypothetical protein
MPITLDPLIVTLISDPTKRTSFVVSIDTPTPRRWTPFPRPIELGGVRYFPQDITVAGVVESLDQSTPSAASLTISNKGNAASDLVRDAANRLAPVAIRRVWFDESWALAGSDLWFSGRTGKPSLRGQLVTLGCGQALGRRGSSPSRPYASLMHSHQPPESQKFNFTGGAE